MISKNMLVVVKSSVRHSNNRISPPNHNRIDAYFILIAHYDSIRDHNTFLS